MDNSIDDTTQYEKVGDKKKAPRKGLVILFTGYGKGKTTAALGMLMRAWGRGMRVAVIQFIKDENARYGETKAAKKMGIDWVATGDGCTWQSKDMEKTIEHARQGWEIAQDTILNGKNDLLLLDEFTFLMHFNWLNVDEVVDWLTENKPPSLHLIFTGRDAPQKLIDYADLVTEMREIKHPFRDQGIKAQPGIEF